ncbi:MAG: hypothetical protein RSB24_09025, partial [Akkermansia sp.]
TTAKLLPVNLTQSLANTQNCTSLLSSVGRRWERDATLRFAPLTQHVLPLTPACRGISGFFFY